MPYNLSMTAPDPSISSDDRRKGRRLSAQCRVSVQIAPTELVGLSDNVSAKDVLVFTDDEVRVTVELKSDGVVKRVPGRLVRREIVDGRAGWAVEFDE